MNAVACYMDLFEDLNFFIAFSLVCPTLSVHSGHFLCFSGYFLCLRSLLLSVSSFLVTHIFLRVRLQTDQYWFHWPLQWPQFDVPRQASLPEMTVAWLPGHRNGYDPGCASG